MWRTERDTVSVEKFVQPVLLSIIAAIVMILIVAGFRTRCGRLGRGLIGAFEDLVELTTVEPDTTTVGAVIDLNSLAFGHHQVDGAANRTFHSCKVFPFKQKRGGDGSIPFLIHVLAQPRI